MESGLTVVSKFVAFAAGIASSSVYAPWSHVETDCAGPVVSDLRAIWYRAILRRLTAKHRSER